MPPKYRPLKVKKVIPLHENPPAHPHEIQNGTNAHRAFLQRSLDRSDDELAAIQTLHRTLFNARGVIVERYGDLALLDIAEGAIPALRKFGHKNANYAKAKTNTNTNTNTNADTDKDNDNTATATTETFKEVETLHENPTYNNPEFLTIAGDYLLRLKLRRKLLNRLSRRINRLAHSMDGPMSHAKALAPAYARIGESRLESGCARYKNGLEDFKAKKRVYEDALERVQGRWKKVRLEQEREMEKIEKEKEQEQEMEKMEKDKEKEKSDKVKADADADVDKKKEGKSVEEASEQKAAVKNEPTANGSSGENADIDTKMEDTNKQESDTVSDTAKDNAESKASADAGAVKEKETTVETTVQTEQKEQVVSATTDMEVDADVDANVDAKKESESATRKTETKSDAGADEAETVKPEEIVSETNTKTVETEAEPKSEPAALAEEDVKTETETEPIAKAKEPEYVPPPIPMPKLDPLLLDPEHQKDLQALIEYDDEYLRLEITTDLNEGNGEGTDVPVNAGKGTDIDTKTKTKTNQDDDGDDSENDNNNVNDNANNQKSDKKVHVEMKLALTLEELERIEMDEEDFEQQNDEDNDGENDDSDNDAKMKYGIGINRYMSAKDKVMEWKRWKTQLLGKIPDQPTFEELMENMGRGKVNVFRKEERRKILMEELEKKKKAEEGKDKGNDDGDEKMSENDTVDKIQGDEDEEMADAKSDNDSDANLKKEESEKSEGNSSSGNNEDDTDADNSKEKDVKNRKDDDKKDKKPNIDVEEFIKRKRFSFEPIPSFYDQDYERCLVIHSDLISNSLKEIARRSIQQATSEYNAAFRKSSELQSQKMKLDSEEKKALLDYRVKYDMWTTRKTMEYAKWENNKKRFEAQQMARYNFSPDHSRAMQMDDNLVIRRALKGAVDRVVIRHAPPEQARGTDFTSSRCMSNNLIVAQVSASLAHCVDTVVDRVERRWISNSVLDQCTREPFPPFNYPGNPREDIIINDAGETVGQVQARIQQQIKKVSKLLATCETNRAQKWSKLMKAKADNENGSSQRQRSVQAQVQATQQRSRYNVAQTNRKSAAAAVQSQSQMAYGQGKVKVKMGAGAGAGVSNYKPSMDPKYSIEAVKARMASDGSVRPINVPKKTNDGLFMRPAGRQRKGMDWDAVNGKWVPQGSLH